jgi:hypothetical protein
VNSDLLNALGKILIDGIRIQTKPTGNLADSQVFVETEMEDAAMRFLQLFIYESCYVIVPSLLLVNRLQVGLGFYGQ